MDQADLDHVYTQLCTTMSEVGEPQALLFLSRFALLVMARELDRETAARLIVDAREGMAAASPT